jgi:hypothetical protein
MMAGMKAGELWEWLGQNTASTYDLEVIGADGKVLHITGVLDDYENDRAILEVS